jgi:hypothetical protein
MGTEKEMAGGDPPHTMGGIERGERQLSAWVSRSAWPPASRHAFQRSRSKSFVILRTARLRACCSDFGLPASVRASAPARGIVSVILSWIQRHAYRARLACQVSPQCKIYRHAEKISPRGGRASQHRDEADHRSCTLASAKAGARTPARDADQGVEKKDAPGEFGNGYRSRPGRGRFPPCGGIRKRAVETKRLGNLSKMSSRGAVRPL